MKTFLSSPIKDAANNIVLKPRMIKSKRDYENFIKWLDTNNSDLKKIKIPDKKKIEKLELKFGDGFFGGEDDAGGSPLIPLIGGGLSGLVFGGGKKLLGKMFPRSVEKGAEKASVPAAESILQKGASKAVPVAEDAAKIAALRGGGEVAAKGGGLAAKIIPGLATAVNLGISGYRFSQGDIVGGSLSALSAVPVLGWAAVGIDLAREFGAFEGTPFALKKEKPKSKIEARLKEQEKRQREEASKSKVTFAEITDKFDKIVSKFEKVTFGVTGISTVAAEEYEPSNQPLATDDPTEPPPPPLPPGSFDKAPDEVLSDAAAFRQQFPLAKGTPQLSVEPYELQMRENTSLGSLGNDPQVDPVHAPGSSHYENRAIDIPINNMELGDRVANWWRGKGYKVLWRVEGHFNHVHVQWSKGQKKDKESKTQDQKGINTLQKQQTIEEFVKGTKEGDRILKDPKLKAQLTGKKYQYRGSMETTPVTDPTVKQFIKNYNDYVRNIRVNRSKVAPPAPVLPSLETLAATSPAAPSGNTMVFMNQPQAQAAPQSIPVPIPIGGGGGGVVIVTPSQGQILNSLWKTMLLTNLSAA